MQTCWLELVYNLQYAIITPWNMEQFRHRLTELIIFYWCMSHHSWIFGLHDIILTIGINIVSQSAPGFLEWSPRKWLRKWIVQWFELLFISTYMVQSRSSFLIFLILLLSKGNFVRFWQKIQAFLPSYRVFDVTSGVESWIQCYFYSFTSFFATTMK